MTMSLIQNVKKTLSTTDKTVSQYGQHYFIYSVLV